MKLTNLTDENFLVLCANHYKKSYCNTTEDFLSDLKRIKYIKKLLTRFKTTAKIDERLILNHIIILNNIFGPSFTCRILFLKLSYYFEYLKPFLLYLNLLPDIIFQVNYQDTNTSFISMDQTIVDKLKNIHINK